MSTNQLNVLVSLMIAIAFLVPESSNAQTYDYPNEKPADVSRDYCGKDLFDTLDKICDGQYNFMRFIRKDRVLKMPDYPVASDFLPSLSQAEIRKILNGDEPFVGMRYRRELRSIFKECCTNKCTTSVLSMYCA